jgi:hypothetical protein
MVHRLQQLIVISCQEIYVINSRYKSSPWALAWVPWFLSPYFGKIYLLDYSSNRGGTVRTSASCSEVVCSDLGWDVRVVRVSVATLSLWTAASNGPTVHPPDGIWVWETTVELYWQGKPEKLGENPVLVHQKSHMDWSGRKHRPPPWEAGNQQPEPWYHQMLEQ